LQIQIIDCFPTLLGQQKLAIPFDLLDAVEDLGAGALAGGDGRIIGHLAAAIDVVLRGHTSLQRVHLEPIALQ